MAEKAHTPGPLWVEPAGNLWNVVANEPGAGLEGFTFAAASYCTKADATLYAAAPDLLEALRTFVAHYPVGVNPFLDDALHAARAAIAAATGSAS